MLENIVIKGASQHNLKNINVTLPRNKFIVITGLSGSGKSSLAFDTLYAEGQRRYVESLSAYARQFLDRMQKPKVEHIEGLSPAIAIEQRTAGSNPRSTVATVTEIYDYLRLLYAHGGTPHCPECGDILESQSAQVIVEKLQALEAGQRLQILAPVVDGRKGEHREVMEKILQDGFVRARVDGEILSLEDDGIPQLDKKLRHSIAAVIDRLVTGKVDSSRLTDSVETALRYGNGVMIALLQKPGEREMTETSFCEKLACLKCGISFGELQPRNFSFNSPYGACECCNGLGIEQYMDPVKVIPNPTLSIRKGAIPGWRRGPQHLIIYYNMLLRKFSEVLNCPEMLTTPFQDLPQHIRDFLLYGSKGENVEFDIMINRRRCHWDKPFEGILENLRRRLNETESDSVRERLTSYLSPRECPCCHGKRLKPVTLAVKINDKSIADFCAMPVTEALEFIPKIQLTPEKAAVASEVLREIAGRLKFLKDVGLDYLTLDRSSGTLSGGEAQRIRLATQLGCGLSGVLYILDEPSIGLHQRDNGKLLATLEQLRDMGNTVVVVEHDLETIERADYVVDLGPGAGECGGRIVGEGTPEELAKFPESSTADFLSGRRAIEVPAQRLTGNGRELVIKKASLHNLKGVTAKIPLGCFTCITGVSGSGKSSLINGTLVPALNRHFNIGDEIPGPNEGIEGLEFIDKAIVIDQSPIGRTPRSNPATYTGAFDLIRQLFATLPEAKMRGYDQGRFSFNVKGGRCEECHGDGILKIEMQFLSDVYVECSHCNGKRFNAETLNVKFKGHSIADLLNLTVAEAAELFAPFKRIARKLDVLNEVGLGYIKLGQPATTLSGGEAQRIKLATELARIPRGHTLYILDEPTTGLHLSDIDQLLKVLFKLRDMGNSVVVIEHNLDVIKVADHIIDIGPEGGIRGGQIVGTGTPEELVRNKKSITGQFLKPYLK